MNFNFIGELTVEKLQDFKNADPEKHQHLVEGVVQLTEIATEIFKSSPEFRQVFAKIHQEFFKYPECQAVIQEALRASSIYIKRPDKGVH